MLRDLVILVAVAIPVVAIAQRLRVPPVVAFLLTGLALPLLRVRGMIDTVAGSRFVFYAIPFLFVVGEACVITGAFQDDATREAAYHGLIWIGAAAVTYAIFFRKPLAR